MTSIVVAREARKVSGRVGAEMFGLDISRELGADEVSFVRSLSTATRHSYFGMSPWTIPASGGSLLGLVSSPRLVPPCRAYPADDHVLPVDSETGHRANRWHTDVTFVLSPPAASALRSVVVPPYGGETLVANTAAAYSDLPNSLRQFADTLWAVHTNDFDYAGSGASIGASALDERERKRRAVFVSTQFRTLHPVVRVHPVTGERALFIGDFAKQLLGYSMTDSREILRQLQSYVTRPENVVTIRWEPDQLLLYDNQATQHYGVDNCDNLPRRLHRVTIAGPAPVGVNGQHSSSLEGDASGYLT